MSVERFIGRDVDQAIAPSEWLRRFTTRLTSKQPAALAEQFDAAAAEWAAYWDELDPEEAADMAALALGARTPRGPAQDSPGK